MTSVKSDLTKECWERIQEIYKARLTINTALSVAVVTLTGYGLQTLRVIPILVSATIPVVAFGIDFVMKWRYAAPILYKLVITESVSDDPEPLGHLFLDFARGRGSRYGALLTEAPSERRRRAFRRLYVLNGVSLRLCLYLGIAVCDLVIALIVAVLRSR